MVEDKEEDGEEGVAGGDKYESTVWSQTIHSPIGGREWKSRNRH